MRSPAPILRRIARESLPVLVLAGTVDIIAGLTIEKRFSSFVLYPALLVLVPPFLEDSGALGGILERARVDQAAPRHAGARAGAASRAVGEDVLLIYMYAVPVFVLLGVSADIAAAAAGLNSPGSLEMIAVSMLGGRGDHDVRASLVGFYGAVATYRLGLDPDNHGIPIVTSSLDLLGALVPDPRHRGPRPGLNLTLRDSMAPDEQPRNLKTMLSEAKDTSELMVDLAYAALFFGDAGMADEVHELEERLSDLAHAMREVCVLAARSPRDAEEMSSVLHVLSAIERMGNAAVDIARIVTHQLGIPAALVADLAAAEEISHRVRVRPDTALANRTLGRRRPPHRGRHARGRHPSRQAVDHRPRRRRHAAARRRAHPARPARRRRRAARSSPARPSGGRPAPTKTPR